MRIWRLVDKQFLRDAWTGEGAKLYGGRWNEPGTPIIYCSDAPALAILETFAGGLKPGDLKHWTLLSAEVPDGRIHGLPPGATDRERGMKWLATGQLACRVPSRVVEGWNLLLNPASADWPSLKILGETPIDPRLWGEG